MPPPSPAAPVIQLTFGPWSDVDVALDPTGHSIAYASNRLGTYDIWVVNVDGRHARQITGLSGDERRPAWSSDGMHIAFVTQNESTASLWIVDTDGKNPRRVSTHTQIGVVEWQPEGSMIVYEALDNSRWSLWATWENNIVAMRLPCGADHCRYPAWGADNSTIFYVALQDNASDIRTNDFANGDHSLALIPGDVRGLSASPIGEYLAFISNKGGEWGLYVIPTTGVTVLPILAIAQGFSAIPETRTGWSANGKTVMTIGQFNSGYRGADVVVALFSPERYTQDPYSGRNNIVFTRVSGGLGTVTSFSACPTSDSLAYAFTIDGGDHLWILLKAKPVSPYGS
jgi:Tol biopolymer transport system component